MAGGFSLTLSENWPPVVVKHLSQRSAFIRVAGARPAKELKAGEEQDDDGDADILGESEAQGGPDRGYFVDVKTLAGALTSKSHSLASLSTLLKVPTPKEESDRHGEALTPDYVRYALRDAQTTWECFDVLARRFATFALSDTGLYDLYSEASLGKAYLRTMKISPWVRADFPPELTGAIMSAYFGGRAEVHIRRQITPVVHCDFLSMYPTVCTLMGLWNFVRANGVTHRDGTRTVKALLARPRDDLVKRLRTKHGWSDLTALVHVRPKRDLFPVRGQYPGGDTLNIGLNYLSADEPQWFTLADVVASKILTGKTPEVVSALWFEPREQQTGLKPIDVAGQKSDPGEGNEIERQRNLVRAGGEPCARCSGIGGDSAPEQSEAGEGQQRKDDARYGRGLRGFQSGLGETVDLAHALTSSGGRSTEPRRKHYHLQAGLKLRFVREAREMRQWVAQNRERRTLESCDFASPTP